MRVQLNVRVSEDTKNLLKQLAEERETSVTKVLEEAIRAYSVLPKARPLNQPKTVLDFLNSTRLAEAIYHLREREEGIVYITDLTYCPLKWKIIQQIPSAAVEGISSSRMLRGSLAHLGLTILLSSYPEFEVEKQVETEVSGVKLRGRADVVTADAVYELKFPARLRDKIPLPQHSLQVWFYRIILGRPRAFVIYITDDEVLQVEVTEREVDRALYELKTRPSTPATDKSSIRFLEEYVAWWKEQEGPLWGNWECNYCPVQLFCPLFKKIKEERKEKKE